MNQINKLAATLADNAKLHREDIKHFETLLKLSRLAASPEEIGKVLLSLSNDKGNWKETSDFIKALQERTDDIFFTWLLAARLEFMEQGVKQ